MYNTYEENRLLAELVQKINKTLTEG